MMYPSHSYESQLPTMQTNVASFGQVAGSFSQTQPLQAPDVWTGGAPQPQGQYMSAQTYQPGYGGPKAQAECEEECVEEECDPDQCGDEQRGPDAESRPCGIDTRPLLPIGLHITTFLGGLCMLLVQLPVLNSLIGGFAFVLGMLIAIFLVLYLVTLSCMLYCTVADPGTLKLEYAQAYTAMEEAQSRQGQTRPQPKPKRAHKTWLYRQPVRRYDHYCRWVTNCIGLLNHREFFVMVTGLVVIGVLGTAIDLVAVIVLCPWNHTTSLLIWGRTAGPLNWICVCFHLLYSAVLIYLVGPMLRVHTGLIKRNELANEWKNNDFYVTSDKHGDLIAVNELSDLEFNDKFDDSFTYDKSRNSFDKGAVANCSSFWCTPRWPPHQMGEF